MKQKPIIAALAAVMLTACSGGSFVGYKTTVDSSGNNVESVFDFSGYLNRWHSEYQHRYRYGNLLKINVVDVEKEILQTKLDIADQLGLTGLQMQEGFLNGILNADCLMMEFPSADEFRQASRKSKNILAFVERESELGEKLSSLAPQVKDIGSYQRKSRSFSPIDAFILKKGAQTAYVVIGDKERLVKLEAMIATAGEVLAQYDMKRGWFGVYTDTQSVTCTPCNQLETISRGMNEGNSWFLFSGLYEYISQKTTPSYLEEAGCPVILDFGSSPVYGTDDFSTLQVQLMRSVEDWEKYKSENGGYLSGSMPSEKVEEDNSCDFYIANPGQAKALNASKKPFAISTGKIMDGSCDCMVLFNKKGEEFDKARLWDAIMSRREVAICSGGCLIGDDRYRQTLQLLVLDRVYMEEYFGDCISMAAVVENDVLRVDVTNFYDHKVSCDFTLGLPTQIKAPKMQQSLTLAPGQTKTIFFALDPEVAAMGRKNAVTVTAQWPGKSKMILADCTLPPAVSVHQLLYGEAHECVFPVSIHNITSNPDVQVKISVEDKDGKTVLEDEKTFNVGKGRYSTKDFLLDLPAGAYTVKTAAMGAESVTQLGITDDKGDVTLKEVDIDGDGMNEYVMENDLVRVTLIRTGARAVELYVKDRDDNVFFKLWPENPVDVNRPYRDNGYWPFGGFEDFLGQASAETHKIFDAQVVKDSGKYAQVRMTGDLNGNMVEKTYTLYGDSPLLDVRFALDFINTEMDILGPQPILSLGKKHWTEDKFYIPEKDGIICRVMSPEYYYGSMFYPIEGWHSGYDTVEDVTFIGAFPVNRPMYLHMWMNHPDNPDTHYWYSEFQPWITIEHGVTSYFSYYMWASSGKWEDSLQALRDRNLITIK